LPDICIEFPVAAALIRGAALDQISVGFRSIPEAVILDGEKLGGYQRVKKRSKLYGIDAERRRDLNRRLRPVT
jgi:hypothetical protein